MKHFMIVAAGCLPLAGLTVSNVFRWQAPVETAVTLAERPKINLDDLQTRAATAVKQATDELPFVRRLVEIDPFADSPTSLDGASVPPRYERLAKAWDGYKTAQTAVGSLAKQLRTKRGAADEVKTLDAYLKTNALAGVRGGESVQQWCEQRMEFLIGAEKNKSAVEEIRIRFAAKKYDDVISRIAALREENLTPSEMVEMQAIRRKSMFAQYWKDDPESNLGANPRARVARLTDLLNGSPIPSDDLERDFIKRREKNKAELQRQIRVDELFSSPPSSLFDLVEECHSILGDDPPAKVRLKNGLSDWITSRLKPKTPPKFHTDEKEAWQKGIYRRGVFQPSQNATPGNERYLYWAAPISAEYRKKTWDKEFYLKELDAEPTELLEVRLCRQYNDELAAVLKSIDTKRLWDEFATACEGRQTELTDYYIKVQAKQRSVTFQAEAQLAREVVNEWPKISVILK